MLAKSINNLKALNIFGKVEYDLVPTDDNKKILNITIEEKPTGEISAAAGTGTSGGTFGFGIKENNFLGKNISLDSNLRVDEETIRGKFSVVNPNWNYSDRALIASVESSVTIEWEIMDMKHLKQGFHLDPIGNNMMIFFSVPKSLCFMKS